MLKFAINPKGINKNWNMEALTTGFENREGSIHDIVAALKKGHAFIGGHLKPGERRSKAAMQGCQFITVEIDNSTVLKDEDGRVIKGEDGKAQKVYCHQMTVKEALNDPFIKENCAIAYTSPSHTEGWNRFRLIFKLPKFVEGGTAEALTKQLMKVLPHDPACKDCSRVFYGNTKADFFIVNDKVEISNEWMAKAVADNQREKVERERARKAREAWLKENAQELEETKGLVLEALPYIPQRVVGSNNYAECFRVLAVLKDLFGEAEAEIIAEAWSPSIPGTTWNIGRKLKSFKRPNGVSVGTLFKIAQQNGFQFPVKKREIENKKAMQAEFEPNRPKTTKEAIESDDSVDSGYARLRLDIMGALALTDRCEQQYKLARIAQAHKVKESLVQRIVKDTTARQSTIQTSFLLSEYQDMQITGAKWLIPTFMPEVGLTLLGGFAKDGKTTLLWDMCRALLKGDTFLGQPVMRPTKVLFIECEETGKARMIERLDSVGLLHEIALGTSLRIEHSWEIDDLDTLERWIVEHQADVVLIDSLRKVSGHLGISENVQEFANPVYRLQTLINNMGKACVILHHTSKNKEASGIARIAGTSALAGATDNIFGLERASLADTDCRRKLIMLGRDCKGTHIINYVTEEYPQFHYEHVEEIGIEGEAKKLADRIVLALIANVTLHPDGMSAAALKRELNLPLEDKTIYKPLKNLTAKQIIGTSIDPKNNKVKLYKMNVSSGDEKTEIHYGGDNGILDTNNETYIQQGIQEFPTSIPSGKSENEDTNFSPTWEENLERTLRYEYSSNLVSTEEEYLEDEEEDYSENPDVAMDSESVSNIGISFHSDPVTPETHFPEPTKDAVPQVRKQPQVVVKKSLITSQPQVATSKGCFTLGSRVQVEGLEYQSGGYSIEGIGTIQGSGLIYVKLFSVNGVVLNHTLTFHKD